MDKNAASLLPEMLVFEIVINQDVSAIHMEAFVPGSTGNHFDVWEGLGSPGDLLGLRPLSGGTTDENNGVQVRNCLIQDLRVSHQRQIAVETAVLPKPAIELF